jgi:molybdopterin-guanine dinucleotide biosynthesis protein A
VKLPAYDAILLAGGYGRRMGGVDKAALVVRGRPLGARVRSAVEGAARVVVVGPDRPWLAADVVTREDPPGAGPLAALAAGLAHVAHEVAVVVAVDLPFLDGSHLDTLRTALAENPDTEVALAVDETGRDQLLLAAWRAGRLRARVAAYGALADRPLRGLLDGATARRVALTRSRGCPPPWFDCDTDHDLRTAERWI